MLLTRICGNSFKPFYGASLMFCEFGAARVVKLALLPNDGPSSFFFVQNVVLKSGINVYTRILAKKYPNFRINSVCPGYVKTYINFNTGILSVVEGAASVLKSALLPSDGPSGLFFVGSEVSCA
ncbi:unnamed protein product [Prunus brigantina]